MRTKTIVALAGGLVLGLLAGLALGGDSGESKATGPGPTTTVDGVPIGWEHSTEGAVAAASAYAGVVADLALRPSMTWDASIRRLAAPQAIDEVAVAMKPGLQSLAAGLVSPDGVAVVRGAPLGYRVVSYQTASATVEVWGVGVVGSTALAPTASWGITTVDLEWVEGDWRLASPMRQAEGPTPRATGEPTPVEGFFAPLHDLKDLAHVPAL